MKVIRSYWFAILASLLISLIILDKIITSSKEFREKEKAFSAYVASQPLDTVWRGWNKYQIPVSTDAGQLIWYGHQLIENTSYYLGPKGTVAQITNGMNCQNCHLEGGTLPYGNNYGKVYATYPQFRARNNGVQSIYDRVNDCLIRSLNGKALDSSTHEMKAIYAYMKWLGDGTRKGVARGGTSIMKLKYLNRPAQPLAGNRVYVNYCETCHGKYGEGQFNASANGYIYPPLWGEHSYNDGAGLFRISNFAGFVRNSMPFGTDYHLPKLSDEEAWDVAAFVNSQPRPHKDQSLDWKDLTKKPVDFPFGPYRDTFSEQQHKYGPFTVITKYKLK